MILLTAFLLILGFVAFWPLLLIGAVRRNNQAIARRKALGIKRWWE